MSDHREEDNTEETGKERTEIQQMDDKMLVEEPRKLIAELDDSKEFREASYEERYRMAEDLLSDLEREGMIRDVSYSEGDKLFSFEFADGGLGGLSLTDFDKDLNY